eukprot:3917001-Amphidinium_carterae.1
MAPSSSPIMAGPRSAEILPNPSGFVGGAYLNTPIRDHAAPNGFTDILPSPLHSLQFRFEIFRINN